MIFDFSDKINVKGLKIIFSNDELDSHFIKRDVFSMLQTHSTNLKVVNEKKSLEFEANKNGTCVGIIQWMSVKLYEDIQYENIPGDVSSHWSTPIYLFDEPIKIRVGDRVCIKAFLGKDSVWFYK